MAYIVLRTQSNPYQSKIVYKNGAGRLLKLRKPDFFAIKCVD